MFLSYSVLLSFFSGEFPSQGWTDVLVTSESTSPERKLWQKWDMLWRSCNRQRRTITFPLDGSGRVCSHCSRKMLQVPQDLLPCLRLVILQGLAEVQMTNKYICTSHSSQRRIHPTQPGLWQSTLHLPSRQKNKSNWRRQCHACGGLASSVGSCASKHHEFRIPIETDEPDETRIRQNAAWTEDPLCFFFFRKDTSCSFSFINYILHSWICDYYVIIITYIILYPAFFSFASSKAQFQDFGVA